jgi:hypothetical protein
VQFLGNVLVDGFVHRALPINFGIQVNEVNAQGGSDKQRVIIRDANRAAFDLGNGASGGIMPAGELQFDGKVLLRPTVALAQFPDLSSNYVQLLHGNRVNILCNSIRFDRSMNKMPFLFLPQICRAGCDENITTFAPASARFSVFFLAQTRY